ncbi:CapA family protein, partial [Roseovarius salis]|uniref:CapA family protein n=1 Tax=Roseovarius salis TaxID=3376063 RepID=UPI0037CBCCB0
LAARGMESSGVPPGWQAGAGLPGIAMLPPLPADGAGMLAAALAPHRARGDVTVLSVHWGANWGFDVPRAQRRLGHALIDVAGVDVVFGHSAHHPMGIELYRGKLILHGCGDLINDYEGIGGQEDFMPRLAVAFILDIDQQTGRAAGLEMLPYRRRAFALERARAGEVDWLHAMLARESLLADAALERSGPGAIRLVMAAG